MKDVVLNEVKTYIISVEDFENYFKGRTIITEEEYLQYLNKKTKNTNI